MEQILNSRIIGEHPEHLLIIHGLFGQLDNWNTLGKEYAKYYTTHLIDLRNHGRSFHSTDMSYDAMIQDLLTYMAHYNIEKVHLLGHSLGGRLAIDMAMNYATKINKLIVADMSPKAYPPHHNMIFKALNSVDFSKAKTRQDVDEMLKTYIPEMSIRQFLLKNVYHNGNGYAFRFNLPALYREYNNLVGKDLSDGEFNGPTLFLGGEKSDYILPEDDFIIRKRFPHAEIDYVSNAGHWLHAENPKEFMQKTLTFLLK
ncbi:MULTISPECIES: alpha/beta fold hydrolase [Weeksella]|uniref:Alpha/beta hydrolase fold protein n=1 Tax=Weeksella virosa (strain ATCC 43766 / DSM 16922 / JCM 21250 / CCUG 30538 / CDC 9751 / IAM 14551 / NBRC 16016 / NCTC 11634 / CL345/78) TaxID=865938 RepID=F0NXL0_WEEVC|nr:MULTISPECIES: alpha/beta fold hydrolase [Weeksella]ADX68000.1 alpha/beta hydrolase fold protein [Weeksella virosa DSM 16922]MDK7676179.1 alpha/beta fold hydrolase [Weeksella virosa]OFM83793.1 alpha/beta hydrolase [Weeksella sp. HMSC059D05]SUP54308.1 Esterase ybfF [Weeksella virosa]VEH64366.1 Esterase ybfF [Weeksella virosa]